MKVAIIGAGFSGTTLYKLFKNKNYDVTLFDKSRGAGGRASTRYIDTKKIDHGLPSFETHDKDLLAFSKEHFVSSNILKQENHTFFPLNGSNEICSKLIDYKNFIRNSRIISCKKESNNQWILSDEAGNTFKGYDQLILTIPATQILELDIDLPSYIKTKLETVTYKPMGTLMVYSHTIQNISHPDLLNSQFFYKVIDNSLKYKYKDFSSYVLHLNPEITKQQNFQNKDQVKEFMLNEINTRWGIDLEEDFHVAPHIWKYCFVDQSLNDEYIYDKELNVGLCGDYFGNNQLETAFKSAQGLAKNF
jgi:renalase